MKSSFKLLALISLACGLTPTLSAAKELNIVTDIEPVHSLVSMITKGITEPINLIPANASPHGFALKPSDAKHIENADILIWVSPDLTPGFERIVHIDESRPSLELSHVDGVHEFPFREDVIFEIEPENEAHTHSHEHEHHGIDPHMWLDPENALIWLQAIAHKLTELDPENAPSYQENLTNAQKDLRALIEETHAKLDPVRDKSFVVFHDAYHYFEARFGLSAAGAIALGSAENASPRDLAEIRSVIEQNQIGCIFSEPQFPDGLIQAVSTASSVTITELDPLGAELERGETLYIKLIEAMSDQFLSCLSS